MALVRFASAGTVRRSLDVLAANLITQNRVLAHCAMNAQTSRHRGYRFVLGIIGPAGHQPSGINGEIAHPPPQRSGLFKVGEL